MPTFTGDAANNIFTGGADGDIADGKEGDDTLSGNGGNDRLIGGAGADTLNGGDHDDILISFDASNVYYAYDTMVSLDIGTEHDILIGGSGDDLLAAGYGDDIDGGSGYNKLFINFLGATSGVYADFRIVQSGGSIVVGGGTISGITQTTNIQGSNYDDTLYLSGSYYGFSKVHGNGGNDQLFADYYTDEMYGDDGNDMVDGRGSQYLHRVDGGAGDDTLYTNTNTFAAAYGGAGNDTIYSHGETYGGTGNDHIVISASYYAGYVYGEDGDDLVEASPNGSPIGGGAGADILIGNGGADTLSSSEFRPLSPTPDDDLGLEVDVLTGAGGDDILAIGYGDSADGGTGSDALRLSLGGLASGVTFDTAGIVTAQPFVLGGGTIQNIETLAYLRGTNFNDTLTIATQAALLTVDAGDGDDVVITNSSSVSAFGGAGIDRFVSGLAGDIFDGGGGTDIIDYSGYGIGVTVSFGANGTGGTGAGGDQLTSIETAYGSAFVDTLNGSDLADTFYGNDGNDSLDGKGGDDNLIGGAGNDTMAGGLGDDVIVVEDAGDIVIELSGQGHDTLLVAVSYVLALDAEIELITLGSGPAWPPQPPPPIDFTGSNAGQIVNGTAAVNVLKGMGGNDWLRGYAGDDRLEGGTGEDTLDGGTGADTMDGGLGDDVMFVDTAGDVVNEAAGEGNDRVVAAVSYVLAAGSAVETLETVSISGTDAVDLTGNEFGNALTGNNGANVLDGAGAADTLQGLAGNDTLIGGAGSDFMSGGLGDDVFFVDAAGDTVSESAGQGNDRVVASASFALGAGAEVETLETASYTGTGAIDLTGSDTANVILGNNGVNQLYGQGGADTIHGFAGADYLVGGSGLDNLYGGTGDDAYFNGTADGDRIWEFAGEGYDTVSTLVDYTLPDTAYVERLEAGTLGATTALYLGGSNQDNLIIGNAGNNTLRGFGGADTMHGLGGDDVLIGDSGADVMYGGAGNDTYYINTSDDRAFENPGEGTNDRVATEVSFTLPFEAEIEVLEAVNLGGTSVGELGGSNTANTITGDAGNNTLRGYGGNDTLTGSLGNDTLVGDEGNDTMSGGAGDDVYFVDATGDVVTELAGQGNDRVATSVSYALSASAEVETLETTNAGGTSAIDLTGSNSANTILGNQGANWLDGKDGNDLLNGLGGADTFAFTTTLGAGNVDQIDGFVAGTDTIALDDAVFATLAPGALSAAAFVSAASAQDADDRIVYNSTTGTLWFDADGNGAGAAVQFATLSGAPALTAADFLVI